MRQIITTEAKPIKLWLDDIEEGALEQAKNIANLTFIFKHIAIMPDSHQGYGMPIGGVMATKNVVVPNAVGVDIGCGMGAVKTSIQDISIENLKKIITLIREVVPVGFKRHQAQQNCSFLPKRPDRGIISEEYNNSLYQLGTLGGGNHFIEIQQGSDGYIWFMVHSGSRNLGFKVAKYYNNLACALNEKWYTQVPKKWQLAFLPIDSEEGQNYINEMQYCVDFAFANRLVMIGRIEESINDIVKSVTYEDVINVAHNYAALEHHYGKNVIVHRKGATKAYKGQLGIVPGSQGTASYIVVGKGNSESFMSCSHGAGRRMGREQARQTLNFDEQKKLLDNAGIIHNMKHKQDLDEAPGAYKDISIVMNNQVDLVDIKVTLKPLAVVKA